jgi:hypothetical protein
VARSDLLDVGRRPFGHEFDVYTLAYVDTSSVIFFGSATLGAASVFRTITR